MPAATTLSRINKHDYFAILGSGAYAVGSGCLLIIAYWGHHHHSGVRESLRYASHIIKDYWPMAVGLLFAAFLIGNALRALPVDRIDDFCGKQWIRWFSRFFRRPDKSPEQKALHDKLQEGTFPFHGKLRLDLQAIKGALKDDLKNLDDMLLPNETRHSLFHFWKAELCLENELGFEYAQQLEGRVRLFATMAYASGAGIFAGIIGMLAWMCCLLDSSWGVVMFGLLAVSVLIFLIFGVQLRQVRGQEVAGVFSAYVALILKRKREQQIRSHAN